VASLLLVELGRSAKLALHDPVTAGEGSGLGGVVLFKVESIEQSGRTIQWTLQYQADRCDGSSPARSYSGRSLSPDVAPTQVPRRRRAPLHPRQRQPRRALHPRQRQPRRALHPRQRQPRRALHPRRRPRQADTPHRNRRPGRARPESPRVPRPATATATTTVAPAMGMATSSRTVRRSLGATTNRVKGTSRSISRVQPGS